MNRNTKYEVVALEMKVDLEQHDITLEELATLYNRLLEESGNQRRRIATLTKEIRELKGLRDYWYKKATGADWCFNDLDPKNWD